MVFILPVTDVVGGIGGSVFAFAKDIERGGIFVTWLFIKIFFAVGVEEFTSGVG